MPEMMREKNPSPWIDQTMAFSRPGGKVIYCLRGSRPGGGGKVQSLNDDRYLFFFWLSDWWRVRPHKNVQDFSGDWELFNRLHHWRWYCTAAIPLDKVIRAMKSVCAWTVKG